MTTTFTNCNLPAQSKTGANTTTQMDVTNTPASPLNTLAAVQDPRSTFSRLNVGRKLNVTERVTVSRLQVPLSLLPKPKSQVEELQTHIKFLKSDLEKRGWDLKAAKIQAFAAQSEFEVGNKERLRALKDLDIATQKRQDIENLKSKLSEQNTQMKKKFDEGESKDSCLETA